MNKDDLDRLARLANGLEDLPPSDEYKTLIEWYDIMSDNGTPIGTKKLRSLLNRYADLFIGTRNDSLGKPNRQVWYKIDWKHVP